ncbi:alcohol dehydrogenase [Caballeronia mineralivorans PML1(12)]|uniref:Alcohol dehydrogenase n=1 Tax=Caballeronia mineralivorans PML1(12) TaxID=908627 RepID=A0A0J1CK42_9BURK|nr:DUF1116 domain-containing protein [Caballeronia mineralivorans]KLU21065.1 alcohol dehydrogenase [Caballeronia mineralivorans PML1(12)]
MTALETLAAVQPQWRGVQCARDAVGLIDMTLLHAGPPYKDPCRPPPPVLSSAVLCCLYERWANDEAQAERLIVDGRVRLMSAQSFNVVTPLAAVISPRTSLVDITDANATGKHAWSLLGSGAGAQIRFGSRNPAIIERMAWRDNVLAPVMQRASCASAVDLISLARTGLDGGDDLHARATSASAALHRQLVPHLDDASVAAMLGESPLFFLTLWMAACHLILSAAVHDPTLSTLVIALAGNGIEAGIRLAGEPSRWHTVTAVAPAGPRINAAITVDAAPLTGDSGVIDAAGFGAQALEFAPEPASAFAPWLPDNWRARQAALYRGANPAFSRLRMGLDAAQVAASGTGPLAAIAMIGADGRTGLLGRGVYEAPVALFTGALDAVSPRLS